MSHKDPKTRRNQKIIQAEKIVNFQVAIPAYIPDKDAVPVAKVQFFKENAKEIFQLIEPSMQLYDKKLLGITD